MVWHLLHLAQAIIGLTIGALIWLAVLAPDPLEYSATTLKSAGPVRSGDTIAIEYKGRKQWYADTMCHAVDSKFHLRVSSLEPIMMPAPFGHDTDQAQVTRQNSVTIPQGAPPGPASIRKYVEYECLGLIRRRAWTPEIGFMVGTDVNYGGAGSVAAPVTN